MNTVAFATGNPEKFALGQFVCTDAGIPIEQVLLEVDELQGENPENIVRAKARGAFEAYGKPVVVSDDSWDIPALRGFPGAYMKSINYWFTPDDFLRLMHGVTDRSVILHQYLAYADELETVVINNDVPGTVLEAARGTHEKSPWMTVVTMEGDNGKSLAEVFDGKQELNIERFKERPDVWHSFVAWYKDAKS